MRTFGLVASAFVLLLGCWASPARAQQPDDITVNVVRENAEAAIVVNGVPVHRARWDPANAGTPVTDAVSTGLWLVDGDNTIAVEAKALGEGGYVEVTMLRSFDEPYLLEQRIDGEGRAETTVAVAGQPRWAWLDAEPWTGDATELLAAVAALHDATARKDVDAFMAAHKAQYDDFALIYGPMPPEMMAQLEQELATQALQPLSAKLKATPYLEGRVWLVEDEAGQPPIRLIDVAETGSRIEAGTYWTRRAGVWTIVR